jgi:hypothetical protein
MKVSMIDAAADWTIPHRRAMLKCGNWTVMPLKRALNSMTQ